MTTRPNDYPKRVYFGKEAATVKDALEEVNFFEKHGAELPAHLANFAPKATEAAQPPAPKAKKAKK